MGDYIVRAISADGSVNAAAMSALEIVRRFLPDAFLRTE